MNRRALFIFSLISLVFTAFLFVQFLTFHEARVDALNWVFNDPVFPYLPLQNCSWPIFSITYGSLILYFVLEKKKPLFLTKLMFSYSLLLIVRVLTLSLLPLKEPESIIYLQDPFLNNVIYPGEIDSDLFFSGHTALIMIFFFLSSRWVFVILAVAIGVLLMIQRVHYSIDIVAAIPFSFAIVWIIEAILSKINLKE